MTTYTCTDGNGDLEVEADSAREAAEEFASAFDPDDITYWVKVYVTGGDFDGSIKVAVEPIAPKCADGTREHDWTDDYEVVGGCKQNPGVYASSGAGVKMHEACRKCGCGKVTDTWAQDREDGEQGLTSVRYEPEMYSTRVAETDAETERADYDV